MTSDSPSSFPRSLSQAHWPHYFPHATLNNGPTPPKINLPRRFGVVDTTSCLMLRRFRQWALYGFYWSLGIDTVCKYIKMSPVRRRILCFTCNICARTLLARTNPLPSNAQMPKLRNMRTHYAGAVEGLLMCQTWRSPLKLLDETVQAP